MQRTLTAGSAAYRFRSTATDGVGNTSSWLGGSSMIVALRQQTSGVTYKGRWKTSKGTSASGGSLKRTSSRGASASFMFTGRGFAWVSKKASASGKASLYIDGKFVKTIDLHASKATYRWIAFAKTFTSSAKHTVKIVCVGTAGHVRIDIDAFITLR